MTVFAAGFGYFGLSHVVGQTRLNKQRVVEAHNNQCANQKSFYFPLYVFHNEEVAYDFCFYGLFLLRGNISRGRYSAM